MRGTWKRTVLSALTLVALGSGALADDCEIIVCRSGEDEDQDGLDDKLTYLTNGFCCVPMDDLPFGLVDFNAACQGPPAEIVDPWTTWLPGLTGDPDAKWINWNRDTTSGFGEPPQSALYCCTFEVTTPGDPVGSISFTWAADNFLGDNPQAGGPNEVGVFLNGVPLSPSFSGGDFTLETSVWQDNVPLLTGQNTLHVYQRDWSGFYSGIIFSASIHVKETIRVRTGQVNGVPGPEPTQDDVGPVDDCFTTFSATASSSPLSTQAFTPLDFLTADQGPPAELVVPGPWLNFLTFDPDARWINWNHGTIHFNFGSGEPPRSALYACDFSVRAAGDSHATITCSWAADDTLGDPSGPNPVGVYINGFPLDSTFSGGTFNIETTASQALVPVGQGTNTIYVYGRDTDRGYSGLLFSAEIIVECGESYWIDEGCSLDGVFGPPRLLGEGTLLPGSPARITLSAAAPLAPALLFLSAVSTPTPFKGGTLKALPGAQLFLFTPVGDLPIPFTWPELPPGTSLYWQYAIQDAAAIHGVALSNAVRSTVP